MSKKLYLLACSVAVTALSPTYAQTTNGNAQIEEEIVVTAQRREQTIDKVPVAVTALSQEALDRAGVDGADGLIGLVPNFNYASSDASGRITIRGVGTESTAPGADPGVAFHVDGIYVPRFYGVEQAAFFDVQRVEVLRGPQGTFFGRNATGGAINVISSPPTDETDLAFDVQFGSYKNVRSRLILGGGVGGLRARLSAQYERSDGLLKNVGTSEDLMARDDLSLRGQIGFDIGTRGTVTLRASYSHRGGEPGGQVPLEAFNTADGIYFVPFTQMGVTRPGPYAGRYPAINVSLADPFKTDQTGASTDIGQLSFSGEALFDLGIADMKLIGSYAKTDFFIDGDADRSVANLATAADEQDARSYSAELQLLSPDSSSVEWILGFFHLNDRVDRVLTVTAQPTPAFCANPLGPRFAACVQAPLRNSFDFSTKSNAGFGQVAVPVVDKFKVRVGVRYTSDKRNEERVNQATNGILSPRIIGDTFNAWTGNAGVEYELDRGLIYANASRGFKSGGFDAAGAYKPEKVNAFEVGARKRFGGGLRFGLTGFYYKYKDQQLRFLIGQQIEVENADSTIWGLEFEAAAQPIDGLNLQGTLGYLNTKINRFSGIDPIVPALGVRNAAGNKLSNSPEVSGQIAISYDFKFSSGDTLTPRVSTRYQSSQFRTPFNNALDRVGGHTRTDARLTYESENQKFTVEAFIENIENKAILSFVEAGSVFNGNIATGSYQAPRTFGLRIGIKN
jgi:iron complex outermembrane recepter protein